ncbi:unnamed protein product [Gongylonema pulchrum]|uniref:Peptidase S1 domain-containing protein n=1 Tax=Gongylonema pulchrum TaxID=637853 RepID=A0A183DJ47_9BILA|nr:unnamed protein product [Gongylonema pulchrum]
MDRWLCEYHWGKIPNDVICTAEINTQNVCRDQIFQGDSGGGLMTQLDDGRWVLLGVVSYGSKCSMLLSRNAVAKAQTYTNVAFYGTDIARFTGFFISPMHF